MPTYQNVSHVFDKLPQQPLVSFLFRVPKRQIPVQVKAVVNDLGAPGACDINPVNEAVCMLSYGDVLCRGPVARPIEMAVDDQPGQRVAKVHSIVRDVFAHEVLLPRVILQGPLHT